MTAASNGRHARLRECVFRDEDIEGLVNTALETAQYCWEHNKVDHYENYEKLANALHQLFTECLALRQRVEPIGCPEQDVSARA